MTFHDIETIDDAKAWLLEQKTVRREVMRMLCKQFSARTELYDFARANGIEITDP